jgi:transposase InsO family protein
MDVASACRTAGISDKTYYGWRKRYGCIGRAKLSEFKVLEKGKHLLKKMLAKLELDKLILKKALIIRSLGPEFTAEIFQKQLTKVGIKPIRISAGSSWENGYNERFNGTLRREVLDAEWFVTTKQAQTAINVWLKQYNHTRPHQALNMRSPVPETL